MGTSPKAVKIDTLSVTPMTAAVPSATRPCRESPRTAATEAVVRPRTVIRIARKATPRIARHAVNAAAPTPASAPNRESGPSIPNSDAAASAAAVPTRSSRSRAMAAHRIGADGPDPVDEGSARPCTAVCAGQGAEHRPERDRSDQRWSGQRDPEGDPEDSADEDPDTSADKLGDVARADGPAVGRVVRAALPAHDIPEEHDRSCRH